MGRVLAHSVTSVRTEHPLRDAVIPSEGSTPRPNDLSFMCGWGRGTHTTVHMWRSEDNLWELFLSSYHVGPRVQTQVIVHSGKHLYLLNHLKGLRPCLLKGPPTRYSISTLGT